MGPYCDHCGRRCFVDRKLRDGRSMPLATCSGGMQRDFELLGEDHRSAINPVSGRPGYDTEEFRVSARQLATRARYLAYGAGDSVPPVGQLLSEAENLVRHLRAMGPRAVEVASSDG
jgi:hypothetical protein